MSTKQIASVLAIAAMWMATVLPAQTPGAADLGGLASVAGAFKNLGLKPEMVTKAVPVLTDYVSRSGGADVGKILAGALK